MLTDYIAALQKFEEELSTKELTLCRFVVQHERGTGDVYAISLPGVDQEDIAKPIDLSNEQVSILEQQLAQEFTTKGYITSLWGSGYHRLNHILADENELSKARARVERNKQGVFVYDSPRNGECAFTLDDLERLLHKKAVCLYRAERYHFHS